MAFPRARVSRTGTSSAPDSGVPKFPPFAFGDRSPWLNTGTEIGAVGDGGASDEHATNNVLTTIRAAAFDMRILLLGARR
jgi:hypothetical protein